MTQPVHIEESGEWTGYVWRRKEAPDQDTIYYWSLSYSGDIRQAAEESSDSEDCPPNLVPDSSYYGSEDEAREALLDKLKEHSG